jgi:hypothetical protein
VQYTEIFSFLLIPNDLTVYRALPKTGFYPVKSSNTLAALVNLSPDSPAQMWTINFSILIFLITFSLVSYGFATLAVAGALAAGGAYCLASPFGC